MMAFRGTITVVAALLCVTAHAEQGDKTHPPAIDMKKMLDESSLAVEVIQNWHTVEGDCPTRQKLVTIRVGELWPGQDYRIPVRMIVPPDRKARGFHLTGGHNLKGIRRDSRPRGVDQELIAGGVGLVHTIVQEPRTFGQGRLADEMKRRFIRTLDPHYSIQYWGWPATIIRAATAAYAERAHFEKGKIALSGGSKNGASPSVSLIYDERMTALHATVSPIWDSPLRLCDREAWEEVDAYNKEYARRFAGGDKRKMQALLRHGFLGGTFGPIYTYHALDAGHSWEEVRQLAVRLADNTFISRNLDRLKARGVDMYFHPGTHDFVAFDMAWGGRRHPRIPVYLKANSGHGQRGHKATERDERNKSAFLLQHFFDGVGTMLAPPSVDCRVKGGKLLVTVQFAAGSGAESGRIWWMYDRGPDGSAAYIRELFPDDTWKDMKPDARKDVWTAKIDIKEGASHIDFFSSHRKTLRYKARAYPTYISCPYTRVMLEDARQGSTPGRT